MGDDSTTDGDKTTANRRRPDSNSNIFSDGEKVLAYHGPRIYEAKVQKAEIRKNEWKYFVHYLGWSKKSGSLSFRRILFRIRRGKYSENHQPVSEIRDHLVKPVFTTSHSWVHISHFRVALETQPGAVKGLD